MKITSTINHRCGHTEVITVWCDGRSRKDRERAEREAASLERAAASDDCCACYHRRAAAMAGGDWADATIRPAVIRAVLRVARLTGGRISRSPLSASLYVTWPTGAWRVSDHCWPGVESSLIRERVAIRRGRALCFARLQPNWLEVELERVKR